MNQTYNSSETTRSQEKIDIFASYQPRQSVSTVEFPDEPFELIQIDEDGHCELNMEALKLISKIDTQIAIITVAGPYRTGKSYLINRLLGRQEGFEIGSTVHSCTRGIWMWGRPLKINDNLHAILLDTEGLGSYNRNQQIDIKIFALSILLSSYFIFNSLNAIDEQALEALSLVVNLSKYIHVKTKPKNVEEDISLFSQYFPSFLWVVRDFSLQLVNSENQEIDAKQYLENSLKPVDNPSHNDTVTMKNEIRTTITAFFKERDCATLFRPVSDEKQLREINKLPYESLRPKFRTQLEALIKKIFLNMKPKSVEGQSLNGDMFAQMLNHYVTAMNSDEVPTISTAWERVIESELKKTFRLAMDKYENILEKNTLNRLPLEEKKLEEIGEKARNEAINILNAMEIVNAPHAKVLSVRERLEARVDEMYEKVKLDNYDASKNDCDDRVRELHLNISDRIEDELYESYQDIINDWKSLKKTYFATAVGPAKLEVYESYMSDKIFEDIDSYILSMNHEHKKNVNELQNKIAVAEGVANTSKELLAQEKEKSKAAIENLRTQHTERRLDYETNIDALKKQLETKDETIQKTTIELETLKISLKEFQKKAKKPKKKSKEEDNNVPSGVDVVELKNLIERLIVELKESEVSRLKLNYEKEFELKIKENEQYYVEQLAMTKKEQKKVFDGSLDNLKRVYETQIKTLKKEKAEFQDHLNELKREMTKKEGDVYLLQEKIKSYEKEKNIQAEHAELLIQLTKSLKGFADGVDEVKKVIRSSK